jgi:hypothetical protein
MRPAKSLHKPFWHPRWAPAAIAVPVLLAVAVVAARAAVTIENGSRSTTACRIISPDQAAPRDLAIAPNKFEVLDARESVECQYRSAGQQVRYTLQPGGRYRFVMSSAGALELRAVAPAAGRGQPASGSTAEESKNVVSTARPAGQARRWPHVRDVKVLVAGGKEYRAFYRDKWQSRAGGIVEAAAARFEEQFPIHFRIVGYRAWEYKTAPLSAGDAFEWLHKIDRGDAELVIGFTMVPFPGPRGEIRGVSQYFSRFVVIPDCWGATGATTRLVHELCHVFGAFHVAAPDSVMQLGFERTPKIFRFGAPVEQMIALAKDVDFETGVESLSSDTQAKIREIYRAHHHPLESVDEDPVVVGYRYQARRAQWAGDTKRAGQMQAVADRLSPPAEEPAPVEEGLQVNDSRRPTAKVRRDR